MRSSDQDQIAARDRLKDWSKKARQPIGIALFYSLAATATWIVISWSIAESISTVTKNGNLLLPIGAGITATAIRSFFLWQSERAADRAGRAMVDAARHDLLSGIGKRGAGMLAGEPAGARAAQIFDRPKMLFGYAARWLPGMRLALFGPLIILVAVLSQSWLSGVLLCLSVLVLPAFIWLTASGTASAARDQQLSLDALSGAFQSRAAQSGLIRAFRAVGRESAYLSAASELLRERTMKILRRAFLSTAVLEFFASISIALVAVYVGFKLLGVFPFGTGETITLKEGMMALVLAPEFFAPIRRLSTLHHDRGDAVAASRQLSAWLDAAERIEVHRLPAVDHAVPVEFRDVSLSHGATPFLDNMSFVAAPGEVTVLSGSSGSGKTSCLLALLGQGTLTKGGILVGGRLLGAHESLADSIAFLRQTPWITEGTLADNLRYANPSATEEDMRRAAERADVGSFVDLGGDGLSRPLARFGTGLSGGQRQRLALARALLRDAPILLLDEPTAHLDAEAEKKFLALLSDIKKDRTLLIASHRPAVIAAADRVVPLPVKSHPVEAA